MMLSAGMPLLVSLGVSAGSAISTGLKTSLCYGPNFVKIFLSFKLRSVELLDLLDEWRAVYLSFPSIKDSPRDLSCKSSPIQEDLPSHTRLTA